MLIPKQGKAFTGKEKLFKYMRKHMLAAYVIMLFGMPLALLTLVGAVSTVTIVPLSLLFGWF